mmetsp:Transcript_14126/g.35870  ORF Transcript_14126/g.35870 Transcript_14126/m.35870 type:complete len:344 (-) Transcript_14126:604-1635(-)
MPWTSKRIHVYSGEPERIERAFADDEEGHRADGEQRRLAARQHTRRRGLRAAEHAAVPLLPRDGGGKERVQRRHAERSGRIQRGREDVGNKQRYGERRQQRQRVRSRRPLLAHAAHAQRVHDHVSLASHEPEIGGAYSAEREGGHGHARDRACLAQRPQRRQRVHALRDHLRRRGRALGGGDQGVGGWGCRWDRYTKDGPVPEDEDQERHDGANQHGKLDSAHLPAQRARHGWHDVVEDQGKHTYGKRAHRPLPVPPLQQLLCRHRRCGHGEERREGGQQRSHEAVGEDAERARRAESRRAAQRRGEACRPSSSRRRREPRGCSRVSGELPELATSLRRIRRE